MHYACDPCYRFPILCGIINNRVHLGFEALLHIRPVAVVGQFPRNDTQVFSLVFVPIIILGADAYKLEKQPGSEVIESRGRFQMSFQKH